MKKFSILTIIIATIVTILSTTITATIKPLCIAIDAGHGGVDGGASVAEIKESDLTLSFAKKLKEICLQKGYSVIMTRENENSLCEKEFVKKEDMAKRANIINQSEATIMISLHMNMFSSEKYSGAQVFYSSLNKKNILLANSIQESLKFHLNNTSREIVNRNNIYLLNHVQIPACIVECGFMSNKKELELLLQDDYQYKVSYAILYGFQSFLNML